MSVPQWGETISDGSLFYASSFSRYIYLTFMLKLRECEKATKFEIICHIFWRLLCFVAFSANLNFIIMFNNIEIENIFREDANW